MNAKWCKRLRKILKDLPTSKTKVQITKDGIILQFRHEDNSFRRVYQDVKHKAGRRKTGLLT